jgi:hypothetical protein
MNNTLKTTAIKYGLILGVTSIVLSLLATSSRQDVSTGSTPFFVIAGAVLIWVIKIALFARAHYEYNQKNNGYISFKDAIIIGLIIIGITEVFSVVYAFLNYQFFMDGNPMFGSSPLFVIVASLISGVVLDIIVLFLLIMLEARWKIFKKAGKDGWAAFIPVYSTFMMLDIVGKPAVWFLLLCIPLVNIIFAISIVNLLAKRFGKDTEYTFGLLFLPFIFYPLLGLSEEQMLPLEEVY